jgi:hypothetical protein
VLRSWYRSGPSFLQALDQLESPFFATELKSGNIIMVRAKVAQGWVQQGVKLALANIRDEVTLFKISSLHQSDGINQDKQSNHVLKDEVFVHVKANNLRMQRDP